MIDFEYIEANKEKFRNDFLHAKPFCQVAIDNFCTADKIEELYQQIPEIETQSADYVFAKNKFEKSKFWTMGGIFQELYDDLTSKRFEEWLKYVTNEDIFVDSEFLRWWYPPGESRKFFGYACRL
jgi:hypothetical protein